MKQTIHTTEDDSRYLIREAIRKIALGRSMERINLAPGGMSGIGTARMIHGYVAKIHDDPADEEFAQYAGTIDVGEYPDETASAQPVLHKGVLLAAAATADGGVLLVPTLFSDVTIFMDAATRYAYVVNFSHVKLLQLLAHTEVSVGVRETEALNPTDDTAPDYDALPLTGNEATTRYDAAVIHSAVKSDRGKEASSTLTAESIIHSVGTSEVRQTADKVVQKVGATTVTVADGKVTLGDEEATEPLVLGNELAQLMLDFLTECSRIMTPTLMGTMQAINFPNFTSLTSRIQRFLSKTGYTK